jgi:hypothetical protein
MCVIFSGLIHVYEDGVKCILFNKRYEYELSVGMSGFCIEAMNGMNPLQQEMSCYKEEVSNVTDDVSFR